MDENYIVENHGECEDETCADGFLFNEQKRALKKLIYGNKRYLVYKKLVEIDGSPIF